MSKFSRVVTVMAFWPFAEMSNDPIMFTTSPARRLQRQKGTMSLRHTFVDVGVHPIVLQYDATRFKPRIGCGFDMLTDYFRKHRCTVSVVLTFSRTSSLHVSVTVRTKHLVQGSGAYFGTTGVVETRCPDSGRIVFLGESQDFLGVGT